MSSRSGVILSTSRSAADQLGHAKPSPTADIYMGGKKRATERLMCLKISSLIGSALGPLPRRPL
jgi:hypothetical protein